MGAWVIERVLRSVHQPKHPALGDREDLTMIGPSSTRSMLSKMPCPYKFRNKRKEINQEINLRGARISSARGSRAARLRYGDVSR